LFHGQYEQLTAFGSAPAFEPALLAAKADYFGRTGEVFEDDRCFESRMGSFLEYYLFDWLLPDEGITPAQRFADEKLASLSVPEQQSVNGFLHTQHSLFEVLALSEVGVRVRDLFTDKEFDVHERRSLAGLGKGDLLEARLVPVEQRPLFSQAFCYHPRAAKPNVIAEIHRQRRTPDPGYSPRGLIFQAAHMALKVERYRNIKVEDIYRFDRKVI
jgi:hypothetical protein